MKDLQKNGSPGLSDKLKPSETWLQDIADPELWHGPHGVIVNGPALRQREEFYAVMRVCNGASSEASEATGGNVANL